MLENAGIKSASLKKYPNESTELLTKANSEISSNASTNTIEQLSSKNPNFLLTLIDQNTLNLQSSSLSQNKSYTPPPTISQTATYSNTFKLKLDNVMCHQANSENILHLDNDTECLIKKRNVNWQSPIHKFANTTTQEKQQQTSPQSISTTSSTHTSHIGENSSISSDSTNESPTKSVRIDECVLEFYDDLINRTMEPVTRSITNSQAAGVSSGVSRAVTNARRTVGEDDGFESLNGKSSSGEDTNASPNIIKNQLRLRLSTLDNHQRIQHFNEVN